LSEAIGFNKLDESERLKSEESEEKRSDLSDLSDYSDDKLR